MEQGSRMTDLKLIEARNHFKNIQPGDVVMFEDDLLVAEVLSHEEVAMSTGDIYIYGRIRPLYRKNGVVHQWEQEYCTREEVNLTLARKIPLQNCRNCGAPMRGATCTYCTI